MGETDQLHAIEQRRRAAEDARHRQEQVRQAQEEIRVVAEHARVAAEAVRVEASIEVRDTVGTMTTLLERMEAVEKMRCAPQS
jgi:membrane protein involved in colicin uptake